MLRAVRQEGRVVRDAAARIKSVQVATIAHVEGRRVNDLLVAGAVTALLPSAGTLSEAKSVQKEFREA